MNASHADKNLNGTQHMRSVCGIPQLYRAFSTIIYKSISTLRVHYSVEWKKRPHRVLTFALTKN